MHVKGNGVSTRIEAAAPCYIGCLFPARSLITSDASYKIVSGLTAEAARGAGNDVSKIVCVRVVPVNCGQFRCRIDVEMPCEVHDSSQGRRGDVGAAHYEPANQPLSAFDVLACTPCVEIRILATV